MIKKSELIRENGRLKFELEDLKSDFRERFNYGAIEHCSKIKHYEVISKLEIAGIITNEQRKIIFEKFYEADERIERILNKSFKEIDEIEEES